MAPELLNTDARKIRYNSAVDVYSFAIILNALWRQRKPYDNDNFSSVLHLLQSVQQGLRPDFPENCPEWVIELMASCWEGDSVKRINAHDVCLRLAQHAPDPQARNSSQLTGSSLGSDSATVDAASRARRSSRESPQRRDRGTGSNPSPRR